METENVNEVFSTPKLAEVQDLYHEINSIRDKMYRMDGDRRRDLKMLQTLSFVAIYSFLIGFIVGRHPRPETTQ